MYWPEEIVDAFTDALVIVPAEGLMEYEVIQELLDETARRVVWRVKGDAENIGAALRSPYTPLGSVVGDAIDGMAEKLTLKGPFWSKAVNALYEYIENNAEQIIDAYSFDAREYDDKV
jgi:hypothetical protein